MRIMPHISIKLRHNAEAAQEMGAPTRLTRLQIKAKGYNVNKQKFIDVEALHY